MRRKRIIVVFACVLCLVGGETAFPQTQTGTINGTVRGPDGEALPGVTVTLTGSTVMGSRTSVTSATGAFRFPSLLPGDSNIVNFTLEGFQSVAREGIRVSVGQTTTLQIVMELSAVADEIVVTGKSPIVDVASPTASTSFSEDLLVNVPNSRDWSDTLGQSPGMTMKQPVEGYGGRTASARGGSVTNNEMAYDGVKITSPLYNTEFQGIVYESVQEVQVATGALPAEVGNMGGTYINVVTKSGGNEFRGDIGFYYQDDSLQSDNLTDDLIDQGLDTAPANIDYTDWSFNIGGPIVRDKLWFNAGYWKKDNSWEVPGFPEPNSLDQDHFTAKITWQPGANHNIFVAYNQHDTFQPHNTASELTTPDSTWVATYENWFAKIHWTAILTDNMFLEFDVASIRTDELLQAQPTAAHTNLDLLTNVISGGPVYGEQLNYYERDQIKSSLSWFKDDWAGSHAFKFGVHYQDDGWQFDFLHPAAPVLYQMFFGPFPLYAYVATLPMTSDHEMTVLNFYAQDQWAVSDRVTLSLGLRYNHWTGGYPAQGNAGASYGPNVQIPPLQIDNTDAVDWTTWEPRLAATIALDDAGRSVLRLGLARYHHSMAMSHIWQGNPNSAAFSINPWFDLDGDAIADPDELFPPIGLEGGASSVVDPALEQPYTDEVTVEFERELFTDFSLRLNATWRKDSNLIESVSDVIYDAESFVPLVVPDPGPDQVFGTADDQELTVANKIDNFFAGAQVTNPDYAEREYVGVEMVATKRLSKNWQALASLVWQDATGTVGNDIVSATGFTPAFDDPNTLINIDGPLTLDQEWQLKVIGTYLLPLGFSVSGFYQYGTGEPLYRIYEISLNQGFQEVVADSKAAHREDSMSRLDLRAEKVFSFGTKPWEIGLMVDIFNVFNENAVTARNGQTGTYDPAAGIFIPGAGAFGRPLGIQAPRLLRLGARLRF